MFTVCVVFMTPHFIQHWWLTDSPRVPDKSERVPAVTASPGPPGTGQPQRKELGKGLKGQSLQWCRDSKSRALPWVAEAGVTRATRPCLNPNPPSLLLRGLAVPELKLEWVRSESAPHNQVTSGVCFVLSPLSAQLGAPCHPGEGWLRKAKERSPWPAGRHGDNPTLSLSFNTLFSFL